MAWPPPLLPTTRTNDTVMVDTHPAEHNAVNQAINDLVAWVKPEAWIPVTLINGWTNAGGAYNPVAYRKVGDMVQIRGTVRTASANPCFILPVGYRPTGSVLLPTATSSSSREQTYVSIFTSGNVSLSFTVTGGTYGLHVTFPTV